MNYPANVGQLKFLTLKPKGPALCSVAHQENPGSQNWMFLER